MSREPRYPERETDKTLEELEESIKEIYQDAINSVEDEIDKYLENMKNQWDAIEQKVKDGKLTEEYFESWKITQLSRLDSFKNLRDEIADGMAKANKRAADYVNDVTPYIYTLNHNYSCYELEEGSGASFSLVNENTIKELVEEKNHTEFRVSDGDGGYTYRVLQPDYKGNYEWNQKQINNALTSGILQGKSVQGIAKMFESIMGKNYTAAIRNARTAATSAQNAGTLSSLKQASRLGINILKEWISTLDDRTRESHQKLDGERVPYDKPFSNGLLYPGDPDGKPSEVYNCRCTIAGYMPGISEDNDKRIYANLTKNETNDKITKKWEYNNNIYYMRDVGQGTYYDYLMSKGITPGKGESRFIKQLPIEKEFARVTKVLGDLAPSTLKEYKQIKKDEEKYDDLQYKYRTVRRYKVDYGEMPASKIFELDQYAFDNREQFGSNKVRLFSNFGVIEIDGKYIMASSQIHHESDLAKNKYKGNAEFAYEKEKRHFTTLVVGNHNRYVDSEAKLFEFVHDNYDLMYNDIVINLLSENDMCESCRGVYDQLTKEFPNVKVNVVSGKRTTAKILNQETGEYEEKEVSSWFYRENKDKESEARRKRGRVLWDAEKYDSK